VRQYLPGLAAGASQHLSGGRPGRRFDARNLAGQGLGATPERAIRWALSRSAKAAPGREEKTHGNSAVDQGGRAAQAGRECVGVRGSRGPLDSAPGIAALRMAEGAARPAPEGGAGLRRSRSGEGGDDRSPHLLQGGH